MHILCALAFFLSFTCVCHLCPFLGPHMTFRCFVNVSRIRSSDESETGRYPKHCVTGHPPSCPPLLPYLRNRLSINESKLNPTSFQVLGLSNLGRLFILSLGILMFLIIYYCKSSSVSYITYDTDLSTFKRRHTSSPSDEWGLLFATGFLLLMTFFTFDSWIIWLFYTDCIPFSSNLIQSLNYKRLSKRGVTRKTQAGLSLCKFQAGLKSHVASFQISIRCYTSKSSRPA